LLIEKMKEDLTLDELLLDLLDKTTMEIDTDMNVLKNETTILTGTHPHGEILPSWLTLLNTAISTNPNPKTSRERTTAQTQSLIQTLEHKSKWNTTTRLLALPTEESGVNKIPGVLPLLIA
jgi:hypothetical protein